MGYGDEIMVTGYAKLLKQKYPNVQIVAGNKKKGIVTDSVIFNGNPNQFLTLIVLMLLNFH